MPTSDQAEADYDRGSEVDLVWRKAKDCLMDDYSERIDTSIFKPPKAPAPLWRYMDFTKFLSLLENQALFFPTASSLPDRSEGVTHSEQQLLMMEALERFIEKSGSGSKGYAKQARVAQQEQEYVKLFIAINSWHQSQTESFAMWRIYASSGEGVGIRTTYDRFLESFSTQAKYSVHFGAVEYGGPIDQSGNYLLPFLRKDLAYEYEKEVRAVVDLYRDYGRDRARWNEEPFKEIISNKGILVSVDIQRLIESVFVSPFARPWFHELVEKQMSRFHFPSDAVRSSSLSISG